MVKNFLRKFFPLLNRFGLSILGLALAVGVTFSLFSISDGLGAQTQKSLENRQVDLYILPKETILSPFFDEFGNPRASLSSADIETISQKPNVTAVCGVIPLTFPYKGETIHLTGIEPDKFAAFYPAPFRIKEGSIFIPHTNTLLIGNKLADRLNVNLEYIITVGNQDLTLSGVLSKTGGIEDSQGFIPLDEAMALTGRSGYPILYVQLNNEKSIAETKKEIMEERPELSAYTPKEYFEPTFHFLAHLKIIEAMLAAAAVLLALIVQSGAFLTDTENRKKELAIFQAFGASRANVFYWMIEAALIVFGSGTILGFVLGVFAANLMNDIIISLFHLSFPVAGFSPGLFGLTLGIAFLISAFSLLAPSFILSNLNLFDELEKEQCD